MKQIEILGLPFSEETERLRLDKNKIVKTLDTISAASSLEKIKREIKAMLDHIVESPQDNMWNAGADVTEQDVYSTDKEVFLGNLRQIYETQTLERINYYLERLKKSITRVKTGKINDINLNRWKEYKNIRTDSLWNDKTRDRSGSHASSYWGNFIPQIPHQMMLRFTKQGEYVLDTFAGSGTTLIECRRLGRNGIGLELNPSVVKSASLIVENEENPYGVKTEIVQANSVSADYKKILSDRGIKKVQLAIMHPPYYDIIRFSDNDDDLSNAADMEDFLDRLEIIAAKTHEVLERGRYACLVIGDKYQRGEWLPLGFWAMDRLMGDKVGFRLKSIIIKNFEHTKGKRNQQELWRYRAMVGGYYVFKHEYIFLFQKD